LAVLAAKIPSFLEKLFEAEKERTLPIVGTIVHHVFVYLKTKGFASVSSCPFEPMLTVAVELRIHMMGYQKLIFASWLRLLNRNLLTFDLGEKKYGYHLLLVLAC